MPEQQSRIQRITRRIRGELRRKARTETVGTKRLAEALFRPEPDPAGNGGCRSASCAN